MDSLLELELNDGRRPAGKAARKFEKELLRRKTGWYGKKYKPDQDFEIAPLVGKYRLMVALQVLTTNGETTYLSDYLRVSDSLRADLRALNLSGMIPGSDEKVETESSYDLSKMSVSELRVFKFLIQKANGSSVQGDTSNVYESLLDLARSLQPPVALLEHEPILKEVTTAPEPEPEARIREKTAPLPTPLPQKQGQDQRESEEERQARIEFFHWERMRKGLEKDPGPWDD